VAVPKRKTSRSRTRSRKANWLRTAPPTVATCPRCKEAMRPHTVCGVCGFYAGRQAVAVQD
jgi:large subunit ribosomal protein L32